MGWQKETFDRLRDREWHQIGELYEHVETQIPLHNAMRHAMRQLKRTVDDGKPLPANNTARWGFFLWTLSTIGVEYESGTAIGRKWQDRIRLRYVAGRHCDQCGGPVIRKTWAGNLLVRCVPCDMAPVSVPVPAPAPVAIPVAIPAPAPVVIPVAVPALVQPAMAIPPKPVQMTPGEFYRREKSFAAFIKRVRLPFTSVTRIIKTIRRLHGDFNAMLIASGKHPLQQWEVAIWFLQHKAHPP